MKQKDMIKLNIDNENNLILIMKIAAVKPLIETLKKYKNEDTKDTTEDTKDTNHINQYLQNLLIKNNPYILKNLINEIIEVYEIELSAIIENTKYYDNENLTTIPSTDKTASGIDDTIDLKYPDDTELIYIDDVKLY